MDNDLKLDMMDVVMLCGGRGKRLRPCVSDCPKPLARINGRPFLDILIDYVASFGFRRFILCTGYMSKMIKEHYQKKDASLVVLFSEEKKPLGTAGALKNAQAFIKSSPFLAMNADSFCRINLNKFVKFHLAHKSLFSLALVKAKGSDNYGAVTLGPLGQVISFDEKAKTKHGSLINAGIYLFEKSIFSLLAANKNLSLEYDLFPKIINKRFYGYISEAGLVDIGTPQRYKEAQVILRSFL